MTEQRSQINEALAKMQGELRATERTAQGQARGGKYKYSTIADVWDAIREPLAKHGLAITQTEEFGEDLILLRTSLRHVSGETIEGVRPIYSVSGAIKDPQAYGSALTYARRYGITALVGIAPADDDDGKAAKLAGHQSRGQNVPAGPRGGQDKTAPTDDELKLYGYPEDGTTVTTRYNRHSLAAIVAFVDDLDITVQHDPSKWDTNESGIAIAAKAIEYKGRSDLRDRLETIGINAADLARHPLAAG